jgi:glycosyltransferase involved in cell wall biosynthesis
LSNVVAQEGIASFVTFHGYAERDDVIQAMQNHDIHIFPSLWDEPFAAVPVEAMSCGLPVIGTTAGGTPEAITHGYDGILTPAGDVKALAAAWELLSDDPRARETLGARARETAIARFEFERYVDQLENVYTECVRGG